MTNSIKYHNIDMNKVMITKISALVLGTITLLTIVGASNAFAQVPALETTGEEKPAALPVAPTEPEPAKDEPAKPISDETNTSFGKVTIPVSSGEQIILEIPLKDGNSYKLLPIK